jgi:hypothetical protein
MIRTAELGAALVALLGAAGCASVKPGADRVVLTREQGSVSGCKEMGTVQTWLSFSFRDAQNQLRNRAVSLGADTVLVTSSFGDSTGTAYSCTAKK